MSMILWPVACPWFQTRGGLIYSFPSLLLSLLIVTFDYCQIVLLTLLCWCILYFIVSYCFYSVSFNSVLHVHFICAIKNLFTTSFPPSPVYFCLFMTLSSIFPSNFPTYPYKSITGSAGGLLRDPSGPWQSQVEKRIFCTLRLVNQSINIRFLRHDKTQANNIMMQPATIIWLTLWQLWKLLLQVSLIFCWYVVHTRTYYVTLFLVTVLVVSCLHCFLWYTIVCGR